MAAKKQFYKICLCKIFICIVSIACIFLFLIGGFKITFVVISNLFFHDVYSSINETCGPYEFICTGCLSLRLCMNSSAYGRELICERGYCNQQSSDMCVSELPTGCDRIDISSSVNSRCESEGVFAIACSACRKFKICVDNNDDGLFDEISIECPESTLFDSIIQKCSRRYACSNQKCSTEIKMSSITPIVETTIKLNDSICSTGRNFSVSGNNCKNYYSCSSQKNGLFQFNHGKCKGLSYFDPHKETCSTTYVCPELKYQLSSKVDTLLTVRPTKFSCYKEGKLPIPCSNCQDYVLCVRLFNGSFGENYTKCPKATKFDPVLEKCTIFYECAEENCQSELLIEISNSQLSDLNFVTNINNYSLINNNSYEANEINVSKSEEIDLYNCPYIGNFPINGKCNMFYSCGDNLTATIKYCPAETSFDLKLFRCVNDTTICKDLNVSQSSIEFQCPFFGRYPLKNNCSGYYFCNQNYNWVIELCNDNLKFNFNTHKCEKDFVCNLEIDKYEEKVFNNFTVPKLRNARFITFLQNEQFVCTSYGRFPVSDSECTQYYYCPPTLLAAYLYKCPTGYLFDPAIQTCSLTYICPETNPLCTTIGQYPILGTNCQKYVFCYIDLEGNMQEIVETCIEPTLFNPVLQICQDNYVCVENIITTTTIKPMVCTKSGRFPIEDSDCTKYYYCDLTLNSYIFKCSTGNFFDPTKHTCTSDYDCLSNQIFKCVSIGLYPMLGTQCTKYYYCNVDANGILLPPVESQCGNGFFNPASQQCDINYVCPELKILQLREKRDFHLLFECKTIGLFPVLDDTCRHYYYCSVDPNEKFLETVIETCPENKIFNPALQICQSDYICPKKESFSCISSGKFLVPDRGCREYFVCNNKLDFVRVTCPEGTYFDPFDQNCDALHKCIDDNNNMECKTIGKHVVKGSFCTEYFFCGINEQLELVPSALIKCPEGLLFNPALQICVTDYICPEKSKEIFSRIYRVGWWWSY